MVKFSMAEMKPALGKNAGGQMVVLMQGNASIVACAHFLDIICTVTTYPILSGNVLYVPEVL